MGGACSIHGTDEKCIGQYFKSKSLKVRDHFEDLNVDEVIIKMNHKKWNVTVWIGCVWLRTG
jgi:hypothetical protein